MDREKLLRMAVDAGAATEVRHYTNVSCDGIAFTPEELADFAELVRADEREECAKVCDSEHFGGLRDDDLSWTGCAAHLANAIRTRVKQEKV